MPFCPHCGNNIGEGSTFCPKCGQRLTRFTPEERQKYINDLKGSTKEEQEAEKEKKRKEEEARRQKGHMQNRVANALSRAGVVTMIVGAIIAISAGVILCAGPLFSPTTRDSISPPDSDSEPDSAPATFSPITFSGSDDITTPPFEITTTEWIVDWSYVPEPESSYTYFRLFIYPRGETLWSVLSVISPREKSGSTYSYAGAGEYYVEISATNVRSWEARISPPP